MSRFGDADFDIPGTGYDLNRSIGRCNSYITATRGRINVAVGPANSYLTTARANRCSIWRVGDTYRASRLADVIFAVARACDAVLGPGKGDVRADGSGDSSGCVSFDSRDGVGGNAPANVALNATAYRYSFATANISIAQRRATLPRIHSAVKNISSTGGTVEPTCNILNQNFSPSGTD